MLAFDHAPAAAQHAAWTAWLKTLLRHTATGYRCLQARQFEAPWALHHRTSAC